MNKNTYASIFGYHAFVWVRVNITRRYWGENKTGPKYELFESNIYLLFLNAKASKYSSLLPLSHVIRIIVLLSSETISCLMPLCGQDAQKFAFSLLTAAIKSRKREKFFPDNKCQIFSTSKENRKIKSKS